MLSAVRHTVIASRALEDGTDDYRHNYHLDAGAAGQEQGQGEDGKKERRPASRIEWKEALWMATAGGARALGIEGEVGSFAVGKAFDALLVDVGAAGAVVYMEGMDEKEDGVQKWVNNGDDRHVLEVYVQGREIKQGRRLREEEEEEKKGDK